MESITGLILILIFGFYTVSNQHDIIGPELNSTIRTTRAGNENSKKIRPGNNVTLASHGNQTKSANASKPTNTSKPTNVSKLTNDSKSAANSNNSSYLELSSNSTTGLLYNSFNELYIPFVLTSTTEGPTTTQWQDLEVTDVTDGRKATRANSAPQPPQQNTNGPRVSPVELGLQPAVNNTNSQVGEHLSVEKSKLKIANAAAPNQVEALPVNKISHKELVAEVKQFQKNLPMGDPVIPSEQKLTSSFPPPPPTLIRSLCKMAAEHVVRVAGCNKYIECDHEQELVRVRKCPPTLGYDLFEKLCIPTEFAQCKGICPRDGMMYPDRYNIHAYFVCRFWEPQRYFCPPSQAYFHEERRCHEGSPWHRLFFEEARAEFVAVEEDESLSRKRKLIPFS